MERIKKIIKSANFWPILIVVFAAVLAGRSLIFESGYFKMHDDLQMMRQLEMEKCFKDWQIPCRWIPDMGYGYGFPLFNFYPPLPYFVGQIFRFSGISFVDTAKLTFALSFVLSGVAMYFFAKEFFGKWGGTLSSIFYIWAPYHSVDVYVRGAMNEAWALIFFPLILWTAYRLIQERKKVAVWIIGLAFSWAGLLLSHNLMVMIFTPIFAVWCAIWILKSKKYQFTIYNLLKSGLLALGLSAFFTLPAILEQKYIHVDTLTRGYYEFIAHFATINQLLFSRFWGYGPSIWGDNDGMPFQVGHIHWILSLVILSFTVFFFLKNRKSSFPLLINVFSLVVGWSALFMAHVRSTPIWQHISPLAFVQFPWRFLTLSTFTFSFVAGFSVLIFKKLIPKYYVLCTAILAIALIAFNWNYFLPDGGRMGPLTDREKFSAAAWDLQRTAGIFDYLPKAAIENPKEPPQNLGEFMEGAGIITGQKAGTNWASFNIEVDSEKSVVRIGIYQFPNWVSSLDGKKVENYVPETEAWGRMYIEVPKGKHGVNLRLFNTPVRIISNIVSLAAWLGMGGYFVLKSRSARSRRTF